MMVAAGVSADASAAAYASFAISFEPPTHLSLLRNKRQSSLQIQIKVVFALFAIFCHCTGKNKVTTFWGK